MIRAARMTEKSWLILIGALWAGLSAVPSIERLVPASIWFKVDQVHVFDAKAGEPPVMAVERTIRRPFKARWIAEVERWNGKRFVLLYGCTGRGENNYSPENDLPDPLDLSWWIYPARCNLAPGQYRIETRWTLSGGQEVRSLSNIFAVTP